MSARGRMLVVPFILLSTAGACVRNVPPQGGLPGLVIFEARGAADADGSIGPGEWDKADCTQLLVDVPGGSTVTADICMMNDGTNLYSMVRYPRTTVDSMLLLGLEFSEVRTIPSVTKHLDSYATQAGTGFNPTVPFTDTFRNASGVMQPDATDGGTNDGRGGIGTSGGMHVYELQHVLDSADDTHDYSLTQGGAVDFCATITVGTETTNFPSNCAGASGAFLGRVNLTKPAMFELVYPDAFAGRICELLRTECPPSPDPPRHPCAEKPALCEKPKFQERGMFLYCAVKPCAVHDELPRNCLVKFPCPVAPGGGGGQPPFYHLTFTGLNDDWDVVLVDRQGGRVDHRVVPIDGGAVVSFQPDARRHVPGLIGDYVAMFVLRERGRVGVRYEVRASLATGDRHYVAIKREP